MRICLFPVTFNIEFDTLRRVRLEVELPGLEEIPQTTSRVTKTGKFSERKILSATSAARAGRSRAP